jgi:hypothetical protein
VATRPDKPSPPYTTKPAPYAPDPRFVVTYTGSGSYRTVFHATPPNPGGKPDTNDAHDSSTQSWRLTFGRRLAVPECSANDAADPCSGIASLNGARGVTKATARIRHNHVDGLYRQLDARDNCNLHASTSARVAASINVRYDAATQTIGVGAANPVALVLVLLRGYCPQRPDGIDRINANYAIPGFSFDPAYDSDRWFRSRTIRIPAEVFHHTAVIRIPLARTPTGTPPRNCAVRNPKIERCTTGGSWHGVLTLTRSG